MNATFSMKAQQIRWIAIALVVVGVGWAGWRFYDFKFVNGDKYLNPKKTKDIQEELAKETSSKTTKVKVQKNFNDYKILSDLNITGIEKKEAIKDEIKPAIVQTKKISDALRITGIQIDSDAPEKSIAAIRYTDPAVQLEKKEVFIKVGEALHPPYNKYVLAEVKSDKIIVFKNEEKNITDEVTLQEFDLAKGIMAMSSSSEGGEGGRTPVGTYPVGYSTPAKTRQVNENEYWIGSEDAATFEKGYQSVLKDVRTSPAYDQALKRNVGVKIDNISPGSQAYQYGVQNGDIIKKINGNPVSSKEAAIEWVKKNPDLPSYEVEIERQGKTITKKYVPPKKK